MMRAADRPVLAAIALALAAALLSQCRGDVVYAQPRAIVMGGLDVLYGVRQLVHEGGFGGELDHAALLAVDVDRARRWRVTFHEAVAVGSPRAVGLREPRTDRTRWVAALTLDGTMPVGFPQPHRWRSFYRPRLFAIARRVELALVRGVPSPCGVRLVDWSSRDCARCLVRARMRHRSPLYACPTIGLFFTEASS